MQRHIDNRDVREFFEDHGLVILVDDYDTVEICSRDGRAVEIRPWSYWDDCGVGIEMKIGE